MSKLSDTFLITFPWKNKRFTRNKDIFDKILFICITNIFKRTKCTDVLFLRNSFLMSLEISGKLLAGRLFIKATEFPMFPLTLSPFFDCNESNSENVTFELCELEAALFDGGTEENRLRGDATESCESECFVVILDKKYEQKDEKHITFLLTLVGKEITDLGKAKLSVLFFLVNNFFISSDILVVTHTLTAETVTGTLATVEIELTGSKVSVQKK